MSMNTERFFEDFKKAFHDHHRQQAADSFSQAYEAVQSQNDALASSLGAAALAALAKNQTVDQILAETARRFRQAQIEIPSSELLQKYLLTQSPIEQSSDSEHLTLPPVSTHPDALTPVNQRLLELDSRPVIDPDSLPECLTREATPEVLDLYRQFFISQPFSWLRDHLRQLSAAGLDFGEEDFKSHLAGWVFEQLGYIYLSRYFASDQETQTQPSLVLSPRETLAVWKQLYPHAKPIFDEYGLFETLQRVSCADGLVLRPTGDTLMVTRIIDYKATIKDLTEDARFRNQVRSYTSTALFDRFLKTRPVLSDTHPLFPDARITSDGVVIVQLATLQNSHTPSFPDRKVTLKPTVPMKNYNLAQLVDYLLGLIQTQPTHSL